ncbi:MAG: uroporphyrinogen decarboxylase family protein [Candidatus Latescibacterota bacterium]
MTSRERLLAVFAGRRPDRVPFFADLSYWYASQQQRGQLAERYAGDEGYLRLHRDLGVGIYLYAPAPYVAITDATVRRETRGDERERVTETVTPVGTLTERWRYCPTSFSWGPEEYAVKRPADLRVVRYVAEASQAAAQPGPLAACERLWGEWGVPVTLTPRTPLAKLVVEWAGCEVLAFLLADAPEEVERTLEVLRAAEDDVYRILAESSALLIEVPDNLSAEVVGGWFRRYSAEYYRHRVAGLHAAGKKVGVHLDGTMRGLIDLLPRTGLDFIESVTPAPVGDLPIEALRPLVLPDTVLWGGIPGALFSPLFPQDELRRHVWRVLEAQRPSGRFVLASADQVPPDGDIQRVRRVADWVEEFGAPGPA